MKLICTTVGALAVALISSSGAFAAERISVKMDESAILNISGEPGTIVIGNPSIADATVLGSKILLHGRSYGATNMIILDTTGKELVSFDLTVVVGSNDNVALFKAGDRFSYVCAPLCQVSMQVGDDTGYTATQIELNGGKIKLATGQSSAQTPPPKTPVQ
jgi:Pilus formation protein N terminal region